jgi:hypothetical protein
MGGRRVWSGERVEIFGLNLTASRRNPKIAAGAVGAFFVIIRTVKNTEIETK